MSDFILDRLYQRGNATIGRFSFQGVPICWSLEDVHRDVKIAGETRIPEGHYRLSKITAGRYYQAYNDRWNHQYAIGVEGVPGFTHIRIHTGNKPEHTEGCILTGTSVLSDDTLSNSRGAYQLLYQEIKKQFDQGNEPYLRVNDE